MKIKVVRNSTLAKILKVEGIVLYPFIFFSSARPSVKIINHELVHILQVKRDGVFKFYFKYLTEYLKFRMKGLNHNDSYLAISYEVEAYQHQGDLTYTGLWKTEFLS